MNGLVATGVHYSMLTAFVEVLHLKSAGIANGIAALFGISASYVGNKVLVFRSDARHTRTLPRFLLVYFLVAVLHTGVLTLWTDYAGLAYQLGFIIASGGSIILTYFSNRILVFNFAGDR